MFVVAGKGKTKPSDMEAMTPLLQLVFYSIDKVYKLRLGKEVIAVGFLYLRLLSCNSWVAQDVMEDIDRERPS